jgi:hypothetical protein
VVVDVVSEERHRELQGVGVMAGGATCEVARVVAAVVGCGLEEARVEGERVVEEADS